MTQIDVKHIAKIASSLNLFGVGKIVLGTMILILAFTGYQTTSAVNVGAFLLGISLLVLGGWCLTASRALKNVDVDVAWERIGKIFGYYLVLLFLAILSVGYELVVFLTKIASN